MVETIRMWYTWGLWTAEMVREAVPDLLTREEADAIVGRTAPGEEDSR